MLLCNFVQSFLLLLDLSFLFQFSNFRHVLFFRQALITDGLYIYFQSSLDQFLS